MPGFDLAGKVALVTGAGARVVCADRKLDWARETAALIGPGGNDAVALETDVSDARSVEAMAARAKTLCGRIDVLINYAGIATMSHRVHEMQVEDWDRLIAINLRGVFLCMRAV
jgi:NAD(P)-dependent dehydrogenase (short-subunit alcohol dehydrogenase family)